nr:D337 [uncultured bacterium]
MAKVRVRPDTGRLQLDFGLGGLRCREQTDLPDTPANRHLLESQLTQIESEIKSGVFDYAKHFPNSPRAQRLSSGMQRDLGTPMAVSAISAPATTETFSAFTTTWLAEMEPTWRVATRDLHRSLLGLYLLPQFGERPLIEISRPDLLKFRADLITTHRGKRTKPLAPASVNHVLKLLRAILSEAASRYGFVDPAAKVKRVKIPRSDIQPFSLDEVKGIVGHCRPDYRPYLTTRFFTGMRSGEVHGLKWSRVDFERRQILVRETYGHGRVEYTKNDGSQREIAMSSIVYAALREQQKATGDHEYVFCNREGEPLDEGNVTKRVWYPLLAVLGLDRRRPYETRHTCATLWLAAGEAPEWIARQLGHTNTEMLFRVYSRYVPNLTRRDGSAFENLVSGISMGSLSEKDKGSPSGPKPRKRGSNSNGH